jgi:hypothetical protein
MPILCCLSFSSANSKFENYRFFFCSVMSIIITCIDVCRKFNSDNFWWPV